jgi:hypothetical protein
MPDPNKPYTKVEREVLEILDQMEQQPAKDRPNNVVDFRARQRKRSWRWPSLRRPQISLRLLTPLRMLLLTVVLAVAAFIVRDFSSTLALILAIGSITSLLSLFFIGGSSGSGPGNGPPRSPQTKRWRGQDIEMKPSKGDSSDKRWPPFRRGPKL